jgi:hypothetical protein
MSLKKIAQQLESQKITSDKMLEKVGTIDMGIHIISGRVRDSAVRSIFANGLIKSIEKSNRGILKAIRGFQEGKETGDDLEEKRDRKTFESRLLKAIEGIQGGGKVTNKTVDKSKTVNKSGGFGAGVGAGVGAGLGFAMKGLGAVASLGALGFGIGAFFTGLSLGDKAQAMIGADMSSTKKSMITLGEAFAETPTEGLLKMGAVAAIGAKFGSMKGALKMGFFGAGLGAFFSGLALGDKGMSLLNVDGSSLSKMMTSLGQGLNAFDAKSLVALGGLIAFGTAFGSAAVIGLPLLGVGLAGFLGALVGVTDLMGALGADGSGLRDMLVNMATGLGALSSLDGENLVSVSSGMKAVGAGMLALMGSQGLSKVIDFVTGLFGSSEDDDVFTKIYNGLQPLSTLNADNLNGLKDISETISGLTSSLEGLSDVDFGDVKDSVKDLGKTLGFTIPMLEAAKKGGKFGQEIFDGYPSLDFGSGLDSFSAEDIKKISVVSSIAKPVPTQAPRMKEGADTASQIAANKTGGNAIFAPSNNSTNNTNNNSTSFVSNALSSHDSYDPFMGTRTA